jgi:hypothetical protein
VRADVEAVAEELAAGNAHAAVRAYAGPLLPLSEAPGVCRLRRILEEDVRRAVLACGDLELLRWWARTPWGEEDLEAGEAMLAALPAQAPGRAALLPRVRRLRAAYGLAADGRPYAPGADGPVRRATSVQRHAL